MNTRRRRAPGSVTEEKREPDGRHDVRTLGSGNDGKELSVGNCVCSKHNKPFLLLCLACGRPLCKECNGCSDHLRLELTEVNAISLSSDGFDFMLKQEKALEAISEKVESNTNMVRDEIEESSLEQSALDSIVMQWQNVVSTDKDVCTKCRNGIKTMCKRWLTTYESSPPEDVDIVDVLELFVKEQLTELKTETAKHHFVLLLDELKMLRIKSFDGYEVTINRFCAAHTNYTSYKTDLKNEYADLCGRFKKGERVIKTLKSRLRTYTAFQDMIGNIGKGAVRLPYDPFLITTLTPLFADQLSKSDDCRYDEVDIIPIGKYVSTMPLTSIGGFQYCLPSQVHLTGLDVDRSSQVTMFKHWVVVCSPSKPVTVYNIATRELLVIARHPKLSIQKGEDVFGITAMGELLCYWSNGGYKLITITELQSLSWMPNDVELALYPCDIDWDKIIPVGDGVCFLWSDLWLKVVNFTTGNCGVNLVRQYVGRSATTLKIIPKITLDSPGPPILVVVGREGSETKRLLKVGGNQTLELVTNGFDMTNYMNTGSLGPVFIPSFEKPDDPLEGHIICERRVVSIGGNKAFNLGDVDLLKLLHGSSCLGRDVRIKYNVESNLLCVFRFRGSTE